MLTPVDLHIHTRHSDGVFTPAEIVALAHEQGFGAIAIADHDSVSGIDEALQAGKQYGIEVIPAIELSIELNGHSDVHLLAYYPDHHDQDFTDRLNLFRERRDRRGHEIIARINEKLSHAGKSGISYDEVIAGSDGALGRPHIARVLMAKGYCSSMNDAFDNYLVPCDVPKEYFRADIAINEIHRIGGIAVLAHPTTISRDRSVMREAIGMMVALGLDGIEAYNSLATLDDAEFLVALARRYRLVLTGGSDFHGNEGETDLGIKDSRFPLDYRLVDALQHKVRDKRTST